MTHTPSPDPAAAGDSPSAIADKPGFRWVPIRALAARHRPRILSHLLALSESDRYLRFGSVASDAQITHYVDHMDFERDEVFGIFNRRLDLLAMAHLACSPDVGSRALDAPPSAEFGVSVLPHARGRGYGSHLFDRAVLHARNRGIERLIIHALSENTAMLAIARKAGASVVREGSESQAELQLPPDDVGSRVEQFVGDTVGELDFRFKAQARAVGNILSTLSDVKDQVMALGDAAENESEASDAKAQVGPDDTTVSAEAPQSPTRSTSGARKRRTNADGADIGPPSNRAATHH